MTRRHWVWLALGLAGWACVCVVWSTSPDVCDLPQARTSAHCHR